jgi:hypothetical protein
MLTCVQNQESQIKRCLIIDLVTGLELAHASTDITRRRRNVHLLTQRRVEHPVLAEPIGEPRGAAEDAAEAHVLSEDVSTVEMKIHLQLIGIWFNHTVQCKVGYGAFEC